MSEDLLIQIYESSENLWKQVTLLLREHSRYISKLINELKEREE